MYALIFFECEGAMDMRGDDDASDTSSIHSARRASLTPVKKAPKLPVVHERPVSKLRPKQPLILLDATLLQDVINTMSQKRVNAALLTGKNGKINGIITDNDLTRRVVAKYIDPSESTVSAVMTKSPKCVSMEDSALDALEMMVDNKFRHLPVLDRDGSVVGLLDIAKCLYDAISIMEKVQQTQDQKLEGGDAEELRTMLKTSGALRGRENHAQLKAMQLLMDQMYGNAIPTLRTIIGDEHFVSIRPTANVREAATTMAKTKKAILVMDGSDLEGILTPHDVFKRVIAKGKSPDLTAVSSVMTIDPVHVSPDCTLLEALREMHDHKVLHLPVQEEDGTVLGVIDVMELLCHSTPSGENSKGWRDFFDVALGASGGMDDRLSESSRSETSHSVTRRPLAPSHRDDIDDANSDVFSLSPTESKRLGLDFIFKVTDDDGNTHRIKSSVNSLDKLRFAVADKVGKGLEEIVIKYIDDEHDEVTLSSDASLKEAIEFARNSGMTTLKIMAHVSGTSVKLQSSPIKNVANAKDVIDNHPPVAAAVGTTHASIPQGLVIGGVALSILGVVGLVLFTLSRKG